MFANVQTTSGSLLEGEADRDVRRVARDIFGDSMLFGMQIMECDSLATSDSVGSRA